MADSTVHLPITDKAIDGIGVYAIKNSEVLVIGGAVALDVATGKIENAVVGEGLVPIGWCAKPFDGDNTNGLTGNSSGTKKAVVIGGRPRKVAVTGASSIADAGKPVWVTDNQTYTLTAQTSKPCGFVEEWVVGTYCWVYMYSAKDQAVLAGAGKKKHINLGSFGTNALQGTSAVDILSWVSDGHYDIVDFFASPTSYDDAIVAGSQALNLEIEGTNVTGGVLTLAYTSFDGAGDMGTNISATAITAANEIKEGETLQVEMAASGTGFTADKPGSFTLWITVRERVGA